MAQDPEVLAAAIGQNVRRLRRRRDLTLDLLAERAGVSKGTVIGVEQARANPSIATLNRLAEALGVGLATLIEPDAAPRLRVKRGSDVAALWSNAAGSRALLLMGTDPPDIIELWDWRLAAGDAFDGEAHPVGTLEILTVLDGELAVALDGREEALEAGDTVMFDAVVPHRYANPGDRPNRFIMSVVGPAESAMVPPGSIAPATGSD
ncbi:MAG TPA: cupin domain-containing protein [Euzebyales bacterium]|nr:cupin domain-containing protein [Euzebyales bacterium]